MGTFLGKNTNKILVFVIDDSLGMGGGVWWGSVVVQNLPSERKLPMGKVQKKVKKTNNSAFSATHTYIKLTLVSFFYFPPSPLSLQLIKRMPLALVPHLADCKWFHLY